MFGFMKQIFVSAMMFFGCNLSSINPLECVLINNQECKVRPKIINVNSDEPVFYGFILKQVSAVVVVKISMVPVQNCAFLMLLKT